MDQVSPQVSPLNAQKRPVAEQTPFLKHYKNRCLKYRRNLNEGLFNTFNP